MISEKITLEEIDWRPILDQVQLRAGESLPTYPGDLKVALLNHAGLANDSKGEAIYQLAKEIARLTTCSDPEITYWFSRLVALVC